MVVVVVAAGSVVVVVAGAVVVVSLASLPLQAANVRERANAKAIAFEGRFIIRSF